MDIRNSLRNITRAFRRVKWYLVALAAGGVLPDIDHLFGGRLWPHGDTAFWIAAGVLVISLCLLGVGLFIALNSRQNRSRILKEE